MTFNNSKFNKTGFNVNSESSIEVSLYGSSETNIDYNLLLHETTYLKCSANVNNDINFLLQLKTRFEAIVSSKGEISFRISKPIEISGKINSDADVNILNQLITTASGQSLVNSSIISHVDRLTNLTGTIESNSRLQFSKMATLFCSASTSSQLTFYLDRVIDLKGNATINNSITPKLSLLTELSGAINTDAELNSNINVYFNLSASASTSTDSIIEVFNPLNINKASVASSTNINSILDRVTSLAGSSTFSFTTEDISAYTLFKIIPPYTNDGSNQTIYLLDSNLNIIAQLDDLEYFNWTRRWRKHDSFEFKINRYKNNAKKITIGNYIALKRGDIVRGGKIQHRELEVSNDGKNNEVWKFAGKSGNGILSKRIAVNGTQEGEGYDSIEAPAETVMKHYIDVNVVNPSDSERVFDKLVVAKDKKRGPTTNFRARFQEISEILESVSLTSGLGWDMRLDLNNKKFVFRVLESQDRSNITLSTKFDNVKMLGFRESEFESENVVYVGGQGEGANREIVKVEK